MCLYINTEKIDITVFISFMLLLIISFYSWIFNIKDTKFQIQCLIYSKIASMWVILSLFLPKTDSMLDTFSYLITIISITTLVFLTKSYMKTVA